MSHGFSLLSLTLKILRRTHALMFRLMRLKKRIVVIVEITMMMMRPNKKRRKVVLVKMRMMRRKKMRWSPTRMRTRYPFLVLVAKGGVNLVIGGPYLSYLSLYLSNS
jgi:hypothetical protein